MEKCSKKRGRVYSLFAINFFFVSLLAASIFCVDMKQMSVCSVHHVIGDKIYDNNKEVIWRGIGGSYLFHADDNYREAWELQLPYMQAMNVNTIRLAFSFVDSSPNPDYGRPSADILNLTRLDWILGFLDQYNIKVILDLHNFVDMDEDFGSQKITSNWVEVARHYRGDSRIVAYELFNEPGSSTWAPWIQNKTDVVKAYAQLTDAIRQVDPEHIVIWESSIYLPPGYPEGFEQYTRKNVVYTVHRWYRGGIVGNSTKYFDMWNTEEISYMTIGYLVEMREKTNAPFWLGEFGTELPFEYHNAEYNLTEQLLWRCEEQVIGWNLWMGRTSIHKPIDWYLPFFPLKSYNEELVRQPIVYPYPRLTDYLIDQQGIDILEPHRISMWHNNDFVTFRKGIVIYRQINTRLENGTIKIITEDKVYVNKETTITNTEGGTAGDININLYPLDFL